jgi:hypothetical protein
VESSGAAYIPGSYFSLLIGVTIVHYRGSYVVRIHRHLLRNADCTRNIDLHRTSPGCYRDKASASFSVTINAAQSPLTLTITNLPGATVGVPYTGIGVTGGTGPYSCLITAGTLPAGLTLNGCIVSGTPTVAGTVNLTVKATDSSSVVETTTGPVSLTVLPAGVTLTITSPPNATVGTPYSGTIGVTGGTASYSCTITVGALPAGLTLSGCLVTGTPTTAGTSNLTVKATDSSNPLATTTGPATLTVLPVSTTLTLTSHQTQPLERLTAERLA